MLRNLFVLGLLMCAVQASAQVPATRPPTISANGSVEVVIAPTRAVLVLTLRGEGADAAGATADADSVHARLVSLLRRHRLEVIPFGESVGENQAVRRMIPGQVDVRTTRDYLSSRGILVPVSQLGAITEILRDVGSTRTSGTLNVIYYVDESDPVLREAHGNAAAMARQRAELMARASGGTLGALISLNTSQSHPQQNLFRLQTQDAYGQGFQASEVLFRITVTGTWQFDPATRGDH